MFSIDRAEIDAAATTRMERRRECQLAGFESGRDAEAAIPGEAEKFLLRFDKEIKQSLIELCSASTNLAVLDIMFTLNGRHSRVVSVAIDILSKRLKEAGFYTHVYKFDEIHMRVTVFSSFEGKITEENRVSPNMPDDKREQIHGGLSLMIEWNKEKQDYVARQWGVIWSPLAFLR